jgi:hypothetical protein
MKALVSSDSTYGNIEKSVQAYGEAISGPLLSDLPAIQQNTSPVDSH